MLVKIPGDCRDTGSGQVTYIAALMRSMADFQMSDTLDEVLQKAVAVIELGRTTVHSRDGGYFAPQLSDLTEDGKMVLDVLRDNTVGHTFTAVITVLHTSKTLVN